MLAGVGRGWQGYRRWALRCWRWVRVLRPQPVPWIASGRVFQGAGVKTCVTQEPYGEMLLKDQDNE